MHTEILYTLKLFHYYFFIYYYDYDNYNNILIKPTNL